MYQDTSHVVENDEAVAVANQETEKPSALIRRAVKNYDGLNGNKFNFNSDFYFRLMKKMPKGSTTCSVCLAGSLASFLEGEQTMLKFYNHGDGTLSFDLHDYMSTYYKTNHLSDDVKKVGVTQALIRDIIVLECVRKGDLSEAVTYCNLSPSVFSNEGSFQHYDERFDVRKDCQNRYHDNPELAMVADDENSIIEWQSKKEWTENARQEFLHRADLLESAGY